MAAIDNLTKSLAIEWAEKGVRINSVAPVSIVVIHVQHGGCRQSHQVSSYRVGWERSENQFSSTSKYSRTVITYTCNFFSCSSKMTENQQTFTWQMNLCHYKAANLWSQITRKLSNSTWKKYLSYCQTAKAQASLPIHTVSPLAQEALDKKPLPFVQLNSCECMFEGSLPMQN